MKKKKRDVPRVSIGTAHFLRNGAGAHKDKKKEKDRRECRRKIYYDDISFLKGA